MKPAGTSTRWKWIAISLLILTVGCTQYQRKQSICDYAIALDSDALPHDPYDYRRMLSVEPGGGFDCALDHIMSSMDQWHQKHAPGVRKILIFVHGGLTATQDAAQDADNEAYGVESGGSYPIYINWDSGFLSSYGEHLVSVSQGHKEYKDTFGRQLLSPFYLFADVGRAVTRIPVVWSEQAGSDGETVQQDLAAISKHEPNLNWIKYAPNNDVSVESFRRLNYLYARDLLENRHLPSAQRKPQQIKISIGQTNVTENELIGLGTAYAITAPAKFGLSWILDGLGTPAWDNMIRRTLLIVDGSARNPKAPRRARPRTAAETRNSSEDQEPVGPAMLLIDKLADHMRQLRQAALDHHQPVPEYEVSIVGHSMGSMVINEILASKVAEKDIVFKNIVYLAAAASVRDCARCVVPYMESNPTTQFYNLCLHPTADLQERNEGFYELPPRGSLLVWIDDFLSNPPTMLDRTMGRWVNVLEGIGQFPQDIRGRMTIKAFSLRLTDDFTDGEPQKHGQFRGQPYWNPAFWQAGPPLNKDHDSAILNALEEKTGRSAAGP